MRELTLVLDVATNKAVLVSPRRLLNALLFAGMYAHKMMLLLVCTIVAPTWGSWSSWSGCSASCGGGRQTRQRECEGGNTCVGEHNEYRDCNQDACPQRKSHINMTTM